MAARSHTSRVRRALIGAYLFALVAAVAVGGFITWRTAAEPVVWRFEAIGPGTTDQVTRCNIDPDSCLITVSAATLDGQTLPYLDTGGDITAIACSDRGPLPVVFTSSVLWWDPGQGRTAASSESLPPTDLPDVAIPAVLGSELPGEQEGETCGVSLFPWPDFTQFDADSVSMLEFGVQGDFVDGADVVVASETLFAGPRSAFDRVTETEVSLADWWSAFRVSPPIPERSLGLMEIWETVIGGLVVLGILMASVAIPSLSVAAKAEAETAAAERARRRFFTGNPDPIITVDRNGMILEWSEPACELLRVETLHGAAVHDFADLDRGTHEALVRGFHDHPTARPMASLEANVTALRGDGTRIPVDLSLAQTEIEGQLVNVAVIRNATDRIKAAQTDIAEARAAQAQQILSATHHELQREIVQVGFAIDDLTYDEGAADLDLAELTDAYARLEEGKDNVAALATLGRSPKIGVSQRVRAEDLVILTDGMAVEPVTIEPVDGVDRLLLRTMVKTVARNSEKHGRASVLRIIVDRDRIELVDNGTAPDEEALAEAWATGRRPDGTHGEGLGIVRRILEAHDATGAVEVNDEGGVTVRATFEREAEDDSDSGD